MARQTKAQKKHENAIFEMMEILDKKPFVLTKSMNGERYDFDHGWNPGTPVWIIREMSRAPISVSDYEAVPTDEVSYYAERFYDEKLAKHVCDFKNAEYVLEAVAVLSAK